MVNLKNGGITFICFEHETCWELVSDKVEPKFKAGDSIRKKGDYIAGTVVEIDKDYYYKVEYNEGSVSYVNIEAQDDWELVPDKVEPKFKVGDKIVDKSGLCTYIIKSVFDEYYGLELPHGMGVMPVKHQDDWVLVPNKFDITTLKPFDKVLVRCNSLEKWHVQFFEKYNTESSTKYPFVCLCNSKYCQCIPYEGNEHLLETTDDCNEFYKNW